MIGLAIAVRFCKNWNLHRPEMLTFGAMLKKPREFGLQKTLLWLGCSVVLTTALYAFQKPWRLYTSMEPYDNIPLPADAQVPAEWVFGRLMYPQHPNARFGRYGFRWGRL